MHLLTLEIARQDGLLRHLKQCLLEPVLTGDTSGHSHNYRVKLFTLLH